MRSLWDHFRSSGLWRRLRQVSALRSGLYFLIELRRTFLIEHRGRKPEAVDADFVRARDPWRYESNPLELDRFARQLALLASAGGMFGRTLEIGCAEGRFTESLAEISREMVVLDISSLALERTKLRKAWSPSVTFVRADLRLDEIGEGFDLIVVAGVLEYFPKAATLRLAIQKLAEALNPGGYLLVETTRAAEPAEEAWWWWMMPRGRRINEMAGNHALLQAVASDQTREFCISLFRKRA